MKRSPDNESAAADEAPELLWFRNWRGVYWFVFASFILTVLLLTILSRVFA